MSQEFGGESEDLADLGCRFLHIACFLHPFLSSSCYTDSPPSTPRRSPSPPPTSRGVAGMISDLAEFRDAVRDALSAVFLGIPERESREASAPEFPVPEPDDFDLSHLQRENVSAVETFSPDLDALPDQICPDHINETLQGLSSADSSLNVHDTESILCQMKETQNSLDLPTHYNGVPSQSPVTDDKGSNIQEENNQSLGNQAFIETRYEQCTKQLSEVPSNIDALSDDAEGDLGTEDLLYSHMNGDGFSLLQNYIDSFLVDKTKVSSPYSMRKFVAFGDEKDSDFEIVDL